MCQSTCCVDWFVDAPICTMQSDAMYKKYVCTQHVVTKVFIYYTLGLYLNMDLQT